MKPTADNAPPTFDPTRRAYRSELRRNQAEQTQIRISAAAAPLFAQHGYVGTSVRAIAESAGVAVETIYTIGGKSEVFLSAFELTLRGTVDGTPLLDLSQVKQAANERTLSGFLAAVTDFVVIANQRTVPLWTAFIEGARSDARLSDAYKAQMKQMRSQGMAVLTFAVGRGLCSAPREPEATLDAIWATLHPSQYELLVVQAGWSHMRYQTWLVSMIGHIVHDGTSNDS